MEATLVDALDLEHHSTVLDVGCGEGAVAEAVAQAGGIVTGIDLVPDSIDRAVARFRARPPLSATFGLGDFHRLPFEDEVFERCYSMETLVHAQDPDAVLRELFRVLRPGGKVVLIEYSSVDPKEVSPGAYRALRKVCELAAMPGWLELTEGRMEESAALAGFRVHRVSDFSRNVMPMVKSFARIAQIPYAVAVALRAQDGLVNGMSAVEMARHPEVFRYHLYELAK